MRNHLNRWNIIEDDRNFWLLRFLYWITYFEKLKSKNFDLQISNIFNKIFMPTLSMWWSGRNESCSSDIKTMKTVVHGLSHAWWLKKFYGQFVKRQKLRLQTNFWSLGVFLSRDIVLSNIKTCRWAHYPSKSLFPKIFSEVDSSLRGA